MIKKAAFILILQCLIHLVAFAQPPQLLFPKWKVGDSLLIKEKGAIKMTIMGMELPMDANTRYQLKVTAKDSEGYTIEVYNMNYFGLTGGGPMEALMKELESNLQEAMKKAEKMRLIVRISSKGEVTDLLNWQEVQSMLQELGNGMATSMGEKYGIPKERVDSLKLEMHAKIDTKEEVMQQTLSPVEYLMSGYNIKYPLTGKLNVLALMYSRMNYFELNQKGVPATLQTKTLSRKPTETQVAYDVVYDRQALLDYINNSSKSKHITKEMLDKVVITEDRTFDFNLTSGWPKKIKMNTHLIIDQFIDMNIVSEYVITQY